MTAQPSRMYVVATAGHVDHGKSTLVRALTGTEPDRLPEERRRGLSIELGYAWTELVDVGEVAFVDVPGHERFLATTLAGVGPVPAVLFVVAADDPWMPQAAEHLGALDALGVGSGVLVVTRADLADPAPALHAARSAMRGTTLAGIPHVVVSGRTGAGLDELRSLLSATLHGLSRPDPAADVRLWLDRLFHVPGAGTVVTGTLGRGTVRRGDVLAVRLGGTDHEVRVRSLESLGRPRDAVEGAARVALDLGGRVPSGLQRDSVLTTPGAFEPVSVVDVELTGAGTPPARPQLHVGAAAMTVHLRPLGDSHARLTLPAALPLRHGDRAVLRDPGDRSLWGVRVLEPAPAPLRRRGDAARRALRLPSYDGTVGPLLADRHLLRISTQRRLGVDVGRLEPGTVTADDWLLSPERARQLRDQLLKALRGAPEGLTLGAATRLLDLPDPALTAALVTEPVRLRAGRLDVEQALPTPVESALSALRHDLEAAPFSAPDADRLAELGLDAATLARLGREGLLLRLEAGIVLLPGADDHAVTRLAELDQPFTVSQARSHLGTTRRVVLPLLLHLDRTGRTARLPDDRRRLR